MNTAPPVNAASENAATPCDVGCHVLCCTACGCACHDDQE